MPFLRSRCTIPVAVRRPPSRQFLWLSEDHLQDNSCGCQKTTFKTIPVAVRRPPSRQFLWLSEDHLQDNSCGCQKTTFKTIPVAVRRPPSRQFLWLSEDHLQAHLEELLHLLKPLGDDRYHGTLRQLQDHLPGPPHWPQEDWHSHGKGKIGW